MPKKSLFILTACLAFFGSCSEEPLDLKPQGTLTEVTYFEKGDDFNRAVLGTYAKVVWLYQSFVCCSGYRAGDPHYSLVLLADDDLTDQNSNQVDRFDVNPTQDPFRDAFRLVYQVVFRANLVLQKLEENGPKAIAGGLMTQPEADTYRGEALFLRSYAYWLAYNLWENAPIVNQRFTSFSGITTPNATGAEILALLKTDLDAAEDLLPAGPKGWNADNRGRVTSGGAKILLGKVLMAAGEYGPAAAKLAEIEPQGYRLMPNFEQNFRLNSENNDESLFELQWGASPGFSNGYLDNDFFDVVGTLGGNRAMMLVNRNQGRGYYPTQTLQNAFSPLDPRRRLTVFAPGDTISVYEENGSRQVELYRTGLSTTGSHVAKYLKFDGQDARRGNYPNATDNVDYNNERVFRLADALLLRAEALLESGGSTTEVIGLLNRIRERARNSTPTGTPAAEPANRPLAETNRDVIHGWVREERRLELAFEGHRLWDLFRWHRAGKINLQNWNWGTTGVSWEPRNIRFPLPQSELDINSGLRQNEAY
jgi:hypothetical protein